MHVILVEKSEGKKPIGRSRGRCEDSSKKDVREIGWDGMDWTDLAEDRS
jgi:hypothetical protein